MAIDTKVMVHAIKAELDKHSHTSRLLPNEDAGRLYSILTTHGFSHVDNDAIANGKTRVTFQPVQHERTKVLFKSL